jgi:acetyl-CoA synthetase
MALDHLDRLTEVWTPEDDAFASSPLGRMASRHGLTDLTAVAAKASEEPTWYWEAAAADVGIRWSRPYEEVLDLSNGIEFPRFFVGGELNWSDYAVDRWVQTGRAGACAIVWEGDDGAGRALTYAELKENVDRAAGALQAAGVETGDAVGIVLPMIPEAAVTLLAAARVGAIAVPMFSGYGAAAIRERLQQADVRVVITADAFPRRGRLVPLKATVDEAVVDLPVRRVLVVERVGVRRGQTTRRDRWWADELRAALPVREAVQVDGDTPCLLLFTSGSTGRPKGCVHTHAGLPFKLAVEARHAMGFDESGTLLWLTDLGWIMGSFVIAAALANGGTAALFEGTPDWPKPDRLWEVAEHARVTVLGISPTAVRALMRHGESWPAAHDLSALRAIGSTGEPWNLEPWTWCFRHVGRERVPIVNVSGGTECGGSLVSGSILVGTKPMSFAGPALGVAADVVDERGRSVRGAVGELVVRAPWPGMTKSLWREADRYRDSYWRRYPGLWHQGDFAYVDRDGFWYLLGRSDDTMNVAGKRIGPAEVESAIVQDGAVLEAAAVGVPDELKGEQLVTFVVLSDGVYIEEVADRLAARVRSDLGPAITPKKMLQVAELPRTRSGKILRRVMRAVYLGLDPGDLSSLDNPDALASLPTMELVARAGRPAAWPAHATSVTDSEEPT